MLTRLRWYWVDLLTKESGAGEPWDRYFLNTWLLITIFEIL